jgi:hypothetical protein
MKYEFSGKLWLYAGNGAWHFITVPKDISAEIKTIYGDGRPGWGSIRVTVSINRKVWETSIFPDKKSNAYLLPVKAEVRKSAGITEDDTVTVAVELRP